MNVKQMMQKAFYGMLDTVLVVAAISPIAVQGAFQCEVQVPAGGVGVSRTATVTYFNDGTSAIAAPYVRLEAGDNAYVRFSKTDAWSKSVEFLATSDKSPASSLNAGEVVEIPVFVYTASQEAKMTLSYTQSSTEAFPWSSIGSSLKPSYVSDSAWVFALATLKSRFGTTWNSYLSRLRANADYLAENGRAVRRLDRLLQIEINHALGVDAVLPVLASVTDAARSARGMGLSFTRSYSSAMYGRFASGILGYGWTDNLSTYAELTDPQTLVFRVPGGGSYSFTKATGTWKPEDARDKTVLTESSTAYTLTYQSGTVQTFAKSNMRTSSIADNCGNTLTFTWSGTTLQKIAHTDGQSLTFAYSGGLLLSVTDDCGRQTTYTYSNSLLTKVTASDGLATSYEYRPADGTAADRALSRIVYPDGTTREFAYDTSSGLVSAISSNGGKETTTISRDGGVVTLTGPDGAETTVKTGVSGETLETTDALGGVSTKGYTEDGLLKSVVSPSGLNGSIEHDALGRVSKSVSAAGTATAFTYEETFGNLKTVMDAKNHAVTYGYDAKGRGTSVTFADGSASKLEYNNRGDVVKSTNRRGQTVTYTYDAKGRVTKKTWSNGRTFTYVYDAHGNVTTAADSETGTVTMQYDSADRLTKITYPAGRGFTFTYDSYGRLAMRTSLDGAVEQFVYDASGRIASVSDGNGVAYLRNAYDATTGRLTKQTNGNGTSVSYLYDKLGRVVTIEHCNAEGKIVESLQYCYDADGRCIRASSLLGEERYWYDNDGQLTYVSYPESPSEAFAYDAVGNRTTANGATYTVNNLNQYTAISAGMGSSATAITYDRDGNMTSLTDANGTTSYSYDTLNRLVAVSNPSAGINWSCRYDVFGNRVSVTDNGVTTERTYLQGSLPSVAAEYVNGQLKERHIVVGAVRVADVTGTTGVSPVESTRYYHADLIGSTRLVTDGNGTIIDRRAYKAFGETRMGGSQSPATATAGYVGTLGVETDPTGLLFMRNRYYSPALGRFIQMDPIGLDGEDVNQYCYCENNCIKYRDVLGLLKEVSGKEAFVNFAIQQTKNDVKDALQDTFISYTSDLVGATASTAYLRTTSDMANIAAKKGWRIAAGARYTGKVIGKALKVKDLAEASYAFGGVISDFQNYGLEEGSVRGAERLMEFDFAKPWVKIGVWAGEKIFAMFHPDAEELNRRVFSLNTSGGSGSTYQDELVDFELPDGVPKDLTIAGSFTISFEWVVRINPQLEYPQTIGYAAFYVDDNMYGLGGTVDENGVLVRNESISVTGEGTHSLRWSVELRTSLPVEYGVRNVKVVRSAKKSAAAAKSAATVVPQYSVQKASTVSAKALSEIPGAALVQNRTSVSSKKAATRTLLASANNEATSPRLYCYERYVAVKGSAYVFELSAEKGATISVSGLPSGFSYANGFIYGASSVVGTRSITITVKGSKGSFVRNIPFEVVEQPDDFAQFVSWLVTFDAQGGNLDGVLPSIAVVNGSRLGILPVPSLEGYTFGGWWTDAEAGQEVTVETVVTDTITLYAHWVKNAPELHLEPEYGEVSSSYKGGSFNGYATDGSGQITGTFVLTVKKPKKGASTTAATLTFVSLATGKKTKINGTVNLSTGEGSGGLAGLKVGVKAVGGTVAKVGTLEGGSDAVKAKDSASLAVLSRFSGKSYVVALGPENPDAYAQGGYSTLSIAMAAKGKAKVSGVLADGTKVTATAQMTVGDEYCCVPVIYAKKSKFGFVAWFDKNTRDLLGVTALTPWKNTAKPAFTMNWSLCGASARGGLPTGTHTVELDESKLHNFVLGAIPQTPFTISFTVKGSKWDAGKAAKVTYQKGVLTVSGANVSGLKLTYTAKTGLFKGSFTVYAVKGGKLVKSKFNVFGAVVSGFCYGTAVLKGKGSVAMWSPQAVTPTNPAVNGGSNGGGSGNGGNDSGVSDDGRDKVQLWEGGPYWADRNIGASAPEDYGLYFWWGDTTGHRPTGTTFSFNFESDNSAIYTYGKSDAELQSAGWVTSDGGLAPAHDAAHVLWGGVWRMPTYQELYDLCYNKCDWTWTTRNGVNGYVVRGRGAYASNSIFLPCAGYGYGTSLIFAGSTGYYWSSVPYSGTNYSWILFFYSGYHSTGYTPRDYGYSVRPVQGAAK